MLSLIGKMAKPLKPWEFDESKAPPPPNGGFHDEDHHSLWEAIWQHRVDLASLKTEVRIGVSLAAGTFFAVFGLIISKVF